MGKKGKMDMETLQALPPDELKRHIRRVVMGARNVEEVAQRIRDEFPDDVRVLNVLEKGDVLFEVLLKLFPEDAPHTVLCYRAC